MVAPGFIDVHGHSEFTLLADPRAEGKLCQGITTEINGNCGLSAAPLFGAVMERRRSDLDDYGIEERWSSFEEYFALLGNRTIGLNVCTLTGHGNLRGCVTGYDDRGLSPEELRQMGMLLRQTVREGSIGLSTGLIYPPGMYADRQELIDLCTVLMKDGSSPCVYATHMRSEGDRLIEAVRETVDIGRRAGIAVHISHLKTSGERNWHKLSEALSLIEAAQAEGIRVTCDRYPYTAASTDLDTVLPSWTYEGGTEDELRRLRDPEARGKIKAEIQSRVTDTTYWERIVITSVASEKNRWMEGKDLLRIAREERCEPVDLLLGILVEETLRVGAVFFTMSEENLRTILSRSYVMLGTDSSARSFGGPTCKGKPHPRGFGTFPRFLGRYVRRDLASDMSEAVRRMTSLPARTFGIVGRGVLRAGAYADVTIFDPRAVCDRATYAEPFTRPDGIHFVIVNGVPAVWEGECTGSRAGRILRNGR